MFQILQASSNCLLRFDFNDNKKWRVNDAIDSWLNPSINSLKLLKLVLPDLPEGYVRRWFISNAPRRCFLVKGMKRIFRNIRLLLSSSHCGGDFLGSPPREDNGSENGIFIVQLLLGRLIYDKSRDFKDRSEIFHPQLEVLWAFWSTFFRHRASPLWRS